MPEVVDNYNPPPRRGGRRSGPEPAYGPFWLWWAVAVFFLASIVSILDRQILNLLVDPVRLDLHITDVQVSLLQGASFAIFYSLVGLPLGFCADWFSRRWLLIFGVAAWSLATVLAGFARDFETLFVARIFVGVGEATLSPCVVSMIRDMAPPDRRGAPISVFLLGQAAGTGISIMLVGRIVEATPKGVFDSWPILGGLQAWRIAFLVCGALGAIVVALLLTLREPRRSGERASNILGAVRQSAGYFRANAGRLAPIYLGCAGISTAYYALSAWAPTMLIRRFDLTAGAVGGMFGSVSLAAGVLGALAGGFIADRTGRTGRPSVKLRVMIVVALLYAVGGLAVFAPSARVAIAMLAVSIFSFPALGVLNLAVLHEITPSHVGGVTTALVNISASLVGLSAGPLSVALLTQHLFADPAKVGQGLCLTILPAVAATAALYFVAQRRIARSNDAFGVQSAA